MFNFVDYVWYKIPHYNGYEIRRIPTNENGRYLFEVRSFKNFNKYPYGYIMQYIHYPKNGGKPKMYYTMTDYKGISRNLKIEDILQILDNEPYYVTESNGTNINSRNRTLPKARPKYAKRDPWSNYEGKSFGDVMKNSTLYNNKVILDNNTQDE